jgi:hypothetical protein
MLETNGHVVPTPFGDFSTKRHFDFDVSHGKPDAHHTGWGSPTINFGGKVSLSTVLHKSGVAFGAKPERKDGKFLNGADQFRTFAICGLAFGTKPALGEGADQSAGVGITL